MADVFVTAIFLSFLSCRGVMSLDATIHDGFYYFVTYCILSLISTHLLPSSIKSFTGGYHTINDDDDNKRISSPARLGRGKQQQAITTGGGATYETRDTPYDLDDNTLP